MKHPLDRPVWNALNSRWSHVARGDARATRLAADHGPFAASSDTSKDCQQALGELVPESGELWLIEQSEQPPPPHAVVRRRTTLYQMVAPALTPMASATLTVERLTDADAPEMIALAALTKPGPFVAHTNRLGRFIGLTDEGRLVAMAGERMQVPGFTEVSGVCTHPDYRGRGYAGALMRLVAERILAEGETPFLHTLASNTVANALYASLGFEVRTEIILTVLARS